MCGPVRQPTRKLQVEAGAVVGSWALHGRGWRRRTRRWRSFGRNGWSSSQGSAGSGPALHWELPSCAMSHHPLMQKMCLIHTESNVHQWMIIFWLWFIFYLLESLKILFHYFSQRTYLWLYPADVFPESTSVVWTLHDIMITATSSPLSMRDLFTWRCAGLYGRLDKGWASLGWHGQCHLLFFVFGQCCLHCLCVDV